MRCQHVFPAGLVPLALSLLWGYAASAAEVANGDVGDIFPGQFSPDRPGQFSRDDTLLITGAGRSATVWDLETGKKLCSLDGHTSIIHVVAFSPDGKGRR